jgi:hypothetical protein
MDREGLRRLPLSIHMDGKDRIEVYCDAASDCAWHWWVDSADNGENGVSLRNAIDHVLYRHWGERRG